MELTAERKYAATYKFLILTPGHQVVSHNRYSEVSCQGSKIEPDSWKLLAHIGGLRAEVAKGAHSHDPVGVVAKNVVPGG